VETVEVGWNVLVGTAAERIAEAVQEFHPRGERPALFGDGRAGELIACILEDALGSHL